MKEIDNELKEQALKTEETATKPKKTSKKKQQPAPEQTTTNPETTATETEPVDDATEQTTSEQENPNWNWYSQMQNVQPKSSNGGSNHMPPTRRRAQKRAKRARIQKASRRINRY